MRVIVTNTELLEAIDDRMQGADLFESVDDGVATTEWDGADTLIIEIAEDFQGHVYTWSLETILDDFGISLSDDGVEVVTD